MSDQNKEQASESDFQWGWVYFAVVCVTIVVVTALFVFSKYFSS